MQELDLAKSHLGADGARALAAALAAPGCALASLNLEACKLRAEGAAHLAAALAEGCASLTSLQLSRRAARARARACARVCLCVLGSGVWASRAVLSVPCQEASSYGSLHRACVCVSVG
jgi:hypothetical protein